MIDYEFIDRMVQSVRMDLETIHRSVEEALEGLEDLHNEVKLQLAMAPDRDTETLDLFEDAYGGTD